jgi:hypothetical protein
LPPWRSRKSDFEKHGVRRNSISRAIDKLVRVGMLRITAKGRMAYADLRCIPSHYRLTYLITFDENSAAIPQLNEWRWLEKQTKASGDLTTRATSDLATAKVEKPVAICTPEPAAICTHYLDLGVEGGAIVGRTNVVRPCRLRLHCRRGGVKCSVPSLRQPELPETSIAPSAPHDVSNGFSLPRGPRWASSRGQS